MLNFTCDDLLKYVYNETSPAHNRAIEQALKNDWSLRDKLDVISNAKETLNEVKLSKPRQSSIDAIMNYARATETALH
jgi:hypothetical protein